MGIKKRNGVKMTGKGTSFAIVCAMMFVTMAFFTAFPGNSEGSEPPSRAGLYQHSETYNVSFTKPSFYGNTDPNYSNNKLENNTWDDIAIVVYLQDMNRVSKKENQGTGTDSVNCGDIYQALFVPLNGTLLKTGTKQRILVEDFTATWCTYCTAVVGAMERMDHDSSWFPDKYIGIEWHSGGGTYGVGTALSVATSRASDYGLAGGIPRYVIDGMDPYVGGSSSPNDTAVENRIKNSINNRMATAQISIDAKGGHDSSKCWVDFTITVEDSSFDNIKVEANAVLLQDAYPRRHGSNNNAYLGFIANDHKQVRVFDIDGTPPSISDVLPLADTVLSGDAEISFTSADVDAPTKPISKKVEVKRTTSETWTSIVPAAGKFIWKTNQMNGANHVWLDGDYEIRITATDYWDETFTVTVPVKVLNLDAPIIILDDLLIQNGLDDDKAEGSLMIYWSASDDEDGTDVLVDLYYSRPGIDWTAIATDLTNTGSYDWDLMDPRIPDGDRYRLKALVRDNDAMEFEAATGFDFEINNPDPPTVRIISPVEGQELSGQPSIKWSASDNEDEPTMLKADIYLSSDEGATYTALAMGAPNSGTYKFDSTQHLDAYTYKAKVVIRDSTGLSTEVISPKFTIYNNDAPECAITYPRDDNVLTGSFDLKWTADDQEDDTADLKYDLMYMFSTSSYWTELRMDEPNTGSLTIDTTELEEGDGIYTFRLVVKDTRNEMSAESRVIIRVYNPDAPLISEKALTSPAAKKATLTWGAYDDDPAETEGLKVWISRSQRLETGTETPAWTYLAEGIPNSGRFVMDVSSLPDGNYKVMLEVYDCTAVNLSAIYILDLVVDNNDPPELSFTQSPPPASNNSDIISFSWSGTDPEGKNVVYDIYYRIAGTTNWISIANSLSATSFSWNTSKLTTGDYQLRIVGTDSSTDKLGSEVVTEPFHIYVKPKDIDIGPTDDDDDTTDDDGNDMTTIILLVLIITAVILVGLALLSIIIIRKRQEAAQLPPPGGMMMPPMMPPQNLPPGQVPTGPLPPQTSQHTLPPAPMTTPVDQAPAAAPQQVPQGPAVPQAPAVQQPPVTPPVLQQ